MKFISENINLIINCILGLLVISAIERFIKETKKWLEDAIRKIVNERK
jgi:hypothetical protein